MQGHVEPQTRRFRYEKLIYIGGACKNNELVKMSTEDVEMRGNKKMVTIPDTKTHRKRYFAVASDI